MSKRAIVLFLLVFTILATAVPAIAARDAGEIAEGISEQANRIGTAMVAIGAVLGIGCIIYGCMHLKKASNNRGDASVGRGLGAIVIGVVLVCVVAFAASGSKTIFGEESSMSERVQDFQ